MPVMEHFYTIQGEGFHSGKPAYFIRLAGCDVGCVWCDVKESWDASKHPLMSVDELATVAKKSGAKLVVITGGEPLMHDLTILTKALHKKKLKVNIETSGAYSLTGKIDWVCVSPKKFKAPLKKVLKEADELKVIIFNKTDFKWAEEHAGKVSKSCNLFFQPEWSKSEQMLPLITEYVKQNPKWRISLQVHKFMKIP
ncbi:MAG: 7-carboxy-7-deazaguanine synthase QueE [Bacteroidia bacterium]